MRDEDFREFRRALGSCYVASGVTGEALFALGSDGVAKLWFSTLHPHELLPVVDAMNAVVERGQELIPATVLAMLVMQSKFVTDVSEDLRRIASGGKR